MKHAASISSIHMSILTLSVILFSSCATPTATPSAPVPPTRPNIETISAPTVPGQKQRVREVFQERYVLSGHPVRFPVAPGEVMVVSVPAQAIEGEQQGSQDASSRAPNRLETRLRYAAILGFVSSGYKVKDAGIVETSTLSMRRYPATETTESVRVEEVTEESTDGQAQVVERKTSTKPSRDYWWSNRGMSLNLKDPTSLWAPELLSYKKLEADYFLRIFEVRFQAQGTVTVELGYDIREDAITLYRKQLAQANARIDRQNEKIRAYNEALEDYEDRYRAYINRHQNWVEEYEAYFSRNAGAPSPTARSYDDPMDEIANLTADALEERELTRWTEEVEVSHGRISAELIDAATGEVAWVGEFSVIARRGGITLDAIMIQMARELADSR